MRGQNTCFNAELTNIFLNYHQIRLLIQSSETFKVHVTNIVSDNFSLLKSATNHLFLKFKSLTHVQS